MISVPLTLLAFDTATTGCSVTVWRAGDVLAHDAREMARGQAEVLLPMAQDALKAASLRPQDLHGVAITRGPGAFTGMRIGLATARGFALSLGVPCIGVTTLEAVAQGVADSDRAGRTVLAAIESKREDIYVQLFDAALSPLCEPQAANGLALSELVKDQDAIVIVGDAAARAQEMLAGHGNIALSSASPLPDTRLIAAIAAGRFDEEKNAPAPEPLYLRPPDAKLPKNQGRARP